MEILSRERLVEALIPIVRRAGALVCSLQNQSLSQHSKPDGTPVTSADLASQDILHAGCRALMTGFPILSEEGDDAAATPLGSSAFVIDPLDGTREFIAGRSEFTVNVALIEDGYPTIGMIYAPAQERLFCSFGYGHVFEENGKGCRRSLTGLAVARSHRLILASRSHLDRQTQDILAALQPCSVQRFGSALKFALIAAAEADAYVRLSPTMVWDCAAGQALVEATGGAVLGPDGLPLQIGNRSTLRIESFVAARTPQLAAQIIDIARRSSISKTDN